MATPVERNKEINNMLEATTGMITAVENDKCWECKKEATTFRDELSKREFSISGLCQQCQDRIFG